MSTVDRANKCQSASRPQHAASEENANWPHDIRAASLATEDRVDDVVPVEEDKEGYEEEGERGAASKRPFRAACNMHLIKLSKGASQDKTSMLNLTWGLGVLFNAGRRGVAFLRAVCMRPFIIFAHLRAFVRLPVSVLCAAPTLYLEFRQALHPSWGWVLASTCS